MQLREKLEIAGECLVAGSIVFGIFPVAWIYYWMTGQLLQF